jgi:hypothetical protein
LSFLTSGSSGRAGSFVGTSGRLGSAPDMVYSLASSVDSMEAGLCFS